MTRLRIENLVHGYDARPVLDGVDLELPAGEFVVLIGPNGAGKTTLLQCVSGVQVPRSGRVWIDGIDLATDPVTAKSRLGVAVDPQKLPPLLTSRECLQLFAGARGLQAVPDSTWALCDALALTPLLDRQVDQGSLGLRQKLGIALGLLGEPALLLLDEPLNGLDPLSAHALKQYLQRRCREHGDTVLLSTHALDVAERFATRALLLVEGRLRRTWSDAELAQIRHAPDRSLEQAMVQAMS
ncbi:ABC transporter ATP-binding protein [Lysobacter cavernae]|uniref:ABC transporter ATP-binding protein n=1 Tax=Lysobacter cavernae TaxID=1685901 RepID=A0ABV7RTL1_9GAMM